MLVDEGARVDEFFGIQYVGLLGHVLVHVGVEFTDSLKSQFAAALEVDVLVDLLEFFELLRREFIEAQGLVSDLGDSRSTSLMKLNISGSPNPGVFLLLSGIP